MNFQIWLQSSWSIFMPLPHYGQYVETVSTCTWILHLSRNQTFQLYSHEGTFKISPGGPMSAKPKPAHAPTARPWLELIISTALLAAVTFVRTRKASELQAQPIASRPLNPTTIDLLKRTVTEWNAHGAPRLGAALAFYSVLSIGPLLLIAISVAGLAFGHDRASGYIVDEMRTLLGRDGAKAIEDILVNSHNQTKSIIATVIGVVTLLVSASGFFGQLQAALNLIWDVPQTNASAWLFVKRRVLSFGMILGICVMLLFSLVVSAGLAAFTGLFSADLPAVGLQIVSWSLSFAVTALLFALTFKVLPDAPIRWRDVWVGALVTALLFAIGKSLIGLYLGRSALSSTYGAAGSMIILLVWIYYSAQIFFLGAVFTHVYATRRDPLSGKV